MREGEERAEVALIMRHGSCPGPLTLRAGLNFLLGSVERKHAIGMHSFPDVHRRFDHRGELCFLH